MNKDKVIARPIMYLLRKKLNLKKDEGFRFANQKENCCYCLSKYAVLKRYKIKNNYMESFKSNVALSWLLNE